MPKAITTNSTFTITKEFQVALLWKYARGEAMFTGLIDGKMEISVDMDVDGGAWQISDLWVAVENGKLGSQAKGELINLDGDTDEHFMLLIMDAITHEYSVRIECWVQDEAAEARYCRRNAA
jgi:hypothetical protein